MPCDGVAGVQIALAPNADRTQLRRYVERILHEGGIEFSTAEWEKDAEWVDHRFLIRLKTEPRTEIAYCSYDATGNDSIWLRTTSGTLDQGKRHLARLVTMLQGPPAEEGAAAGPLSQASAIEAHRHPAATNPPRLAYTQPNTRSLFL